jgi:hypothetical protein
VVGNNDADSRPVAQKKVDWWDEVALGVEGAGRCRLIWELVQDLEKSSAKEQKIRNVFGMQQGFLLEVQSDAKNSKSKQSKNNWTCCWLPRDQSLDSQSPGPLLTAALTRQHRAASFFLS